MFVGAYERDDRERAMQVRGKRQIPPLFSLRPKWRGVERGTGWERLS